MSMADHLIYNQNNMQKWHKSLQIYKFVKKLIPQSGFNFACSMTTTIQRIITRDVLTLTTNQ